MIRDTLVIIDDSELDLAILREIFKNLFRVECISNERQGLSYLRQHAEQVCGVILDICLERRGAGFTVLNKIQTDSVIASLPVIFITADAYEQDVQKSVEHGAVDFLVKPVNPHTVQERVCSVVRQAWPPRTTILDGKEQEQDAAGNGPEDAPAEQSPLEKTREQWADWTRRLSAFCRLRPGFRMEDYLRLGELTELLARRYGERFPQAGLSREDAVMIGMAAVFCDIGLLGLPDQTARPREDESGQDLSEYYQHVRLGYELLKDDKNPLLHCAAEIALWHHKNADGTGYPPQSAASDMPLSAQLTRAAMRVRHYLHYYRGCADRVERMIHALKKEAGVVIPVRIYEMICSEQETLEKVL